MTVGSWDEAGLPGSHEPPGWPRGHDRVGGLRRTPHVPRLGSAHAGFSATLPHQGPWAQFQTLERLLPALGGVSGGRKAVPKWQLPGVGLHSCLICGEHIWGDRARQPGDYRVQCPQLPRSVLWGMATPPDLRRAGVPTLPRSQASTGAPGPPSPSGMWPGHLHRWAFLGGQRGSRFLSFP